MNRLAWLFVAALALSPYSSAEWKERVLYSFQGLPNDGSYPAAGVVFDKAGNLYGTTSQGGATNCLPISFCGTVFRLSPPPKKGGVWTETVLHIFKGVTTANNDGATPNGGVLLDQVGNLYGTTAYGGTGNCKLFGGRSGCGIVFELSPPKTKGDKWTEHVLYSFQGGKDGYFPSGNLTWDSAGNLYGATQFGGGYGSCDAPYYQYCGTIFEVSPPTVKGGKWKEQVLYAFKSGEDGAAPDGGLVFDSKGALYGTTFYGGNTADNCNGGNEFIGCGTVFELKPERAKGRVWTEKVLLHFKPNASMGGNPGGGVIFGPNGDLYGTTSWGGHLPAYDNGTVFRLSRQGDGSWAETLLHSFRDQSFNGSDLLGGLIFDARGSLYGTASRGGDHLAGTVFRVAPSVGTQKGWRTTTLYSFRRAPDGATPQSNLAFDNAGNLYGTTVYGGNGTGCEYGGCGTVFELEP